MEHIIDLAQRNKNKLSGLRMQIKGRVNGAERKQKRVISHGPQIQQHTGAFIEYAEDRTETKFGTLGLKVQVSKGITVPTSKKRKVLSF